MQEKIIKADDVNQSKSLTYEVKSDMINVRDAAGYDATVTSYLTFGDKVTVQDVAVLDGENWGQIDIGYVCMRYLNKI